MAVLQVGQGLLEVFDVSVFPLAEGALGFAVLLSPTLKVLLVLDSGM